MKVFGKNVLFGGSGIVKRFADSHKVGFCRVPDLGRLADSVKFTSTIRAVPTSCLCLGAATVTEDQGSTPRCAAYSASSYAENLIWRKTGSIPDPVDPARLYKQAKKTDGDPYGDGTTLVDVLEALKTFGYFGKDLRVRVVTAPFDVKSAVHRYGACLLGLDVTEEWYRGNRDIADTGSEHVGGHAVQCVGYDETGCWIQNSWGSDWGSGGFARVSWPAFGKQFMYGAFIEGALEGMK